MFHLNDMRPLTSIISWITLSLEELNVLLFDFAQTINRENNLLDSIMAAKILVVRKYGAILLDDLRNLYGLIHIFALLFYFYTSFILLGLLRPSKGCFWQ